MLSQRVLPAAARTVTAVGAAGKATQVVDAHSRLRARRRRGPHGPADRWRPWRRIG
jgi:hypothetical protein